MCLRVFLGIQLPLLQLRNTYYPVSVPFLWGKEERHWREGVKKEHWSGWDWHGTSWFVSWGFILYIIWNRCTRLFPPASLPVVWLTKVFLFVKASSIQNFFVSSIETCVLSSPRLIFLPFHFSKKSYIILKKSLWFHCTLRHLIVKQGNWILTNWANFWLQNCLFFIWKLRWKNKP